MPRNYLITASLFALLFTCACTKPIPKSIEKDANKSAAAQRITSTPKLSNPAKEGVVESTFVEGFEVTIQHSDTPKLRFKDANHPIYECSFGQGDRVALLFTDNSSAKGDLIACVEVKHAANNGYEYIFYQLAKKFQILDYLKTGYSRFRVVQLPGGGKAIEGEDILGQWGATTVAPTLALHWNGNELDLVRKKRSSNKLLKTKASEMRTMFQLVDSDAAGTINLAPPALAEETLNLVYNGETDQARKMFHMSWPRERKGKERYWNFIMSSAKRSPLWLYVQRSNEPKKTARSVSASPKVLKEGHP